MLSARVLEDSSSKVRKQPGPPGGGKDKPPKKAPEHGKDGSPSPSAQSQRRAQQLALARDVEMSWYLKLCGLSSEGTPAGVTGMPHR